MKNIPTKAEKITIDRYILDTLMRDLVGHDRAPSSFIIYLHLCSLGKEANKDSIAASLQMIAKATGLSKSSVSNGLRHLRARQLLITSRSGATDVPRHRLCQPWRKV